jgi:hypothetical protein
MKTTKRRVLVVGASGKMGSKIVREIVALGTATVRVTHREGSNPEQVAKLRAAGAELIKADLSDEASLARACAGIEVIVSSVLGPRDTIVDGQTRLLRAAEKAGVTRMIPSDYSLDFFKTTEGGNRNLDLRREFNRVLDASSVRAARPSCGASGLLDKRWRPTRRLNQGLGRRDHLRFHEQRRPRSTSRLWRRRARAEGASRGLLSPRKPALASRSFGASRKIEQAGTLRDLEQTIDKLRQPMKRRRMSFRSGSNSSTPATWRVVAASSPLDNDRYPSVRPQTVRDLRTHSA